MSTGASAVRLFAVLAWCFALGAGCGGDEEPAEGGQGATKTASSEKAESSSKPLDQARASEIAKLELPGYQQVSEAASAGTAMPFYTAAQPNANGVTLQIRATASKCVICEPMDGEAWRKNGNLKQGMPKVHIENPDLVWEIDELEADGRKAIYVYKKSFHVSEDGKSRTSVHGVDVHYNNGTNQVMISVSGKGLFPRTAEELDKISKAELLAAGKAALEVFAAEL